MEVSTELTIGTTLSGTVTVILIGCGGIMIFTVGTGVATTAMTFIWVGIVSSIFIVTNESITALTAIIVVTTTIGTADIVVVTEYFEQKFDGLLLFARLL